MHRSSNADGLSPRAASRTVLSSSVGAWQTWPMNRDTLSDHGCRFPPEIINHAVWLSHRVGVSVRAVEDLLAQRGLTVSYEATRLWCLTVGSVDALVPHAVAGAGASAGAGGHRHAADRQGCTPSGPAVRRPGHGPIRAQPHRGFASTDTAPRATPAPVQSSRSGGKKPCTSPLSRNILSDSLVCRFADGSIRSMTQRLVSTSRVSSRSVFSMIRTRPAAARSSGVVA